jgi:hypothetical protein
MNDARLVYSVARRAVPVPPAFAIGLAVANAPNEWYWAYLLMFGLSVAVIVEAPRVRAPSPRTTAVVVAVYGLAISPTCCARNRNHARLRRFPSGLGRLFGYVARWSAMG